MEYVFGYKVCLLCSNPEPLLTSFNKIFMGKIFIVFEELPTFTQSQWTGVSTKLKTLCTEKKTMYRDVYEKAIQADNISNFIINTNEEVKDTNGRRIIPLDISLSKKGDYEYFKNIRDKCFNKKVGEAIFSYLLTKITDEECKNFNGQEHFPETKSKLISIAKLLPSPFKFIKSEFVLKNKSITVIKRGDFYFEYTIFCHSLNIKPIHKSDFFTKLEEIKILTTKINGDYCYKESLESLKNISDSEKWICEYDDFENEDCENPLDNGLIIQEDPKDIEIRELKQQLKEYEEKEAQQKIRKDEKKKENKNNIE
jgi:hypothetical protein